jgi:hypothetical protein
MHKFAQQHAGPGFGIKLKVANQRTDRKLVTQGDMGSIKGRSLAGTMPAQGLLMAD